MRARVRACARADLAVGRVLPCALPPGSDRRPREALLLLGSDGEPRAYLNRCRHLPIPIDSGSRQFLTKDGKHLLCGTHGALYQLDDGMCVAGPCLHLTLERLPIEIDQGELFVLVLP